MNINCFVFVWSYEAVFSTFAEKIASNDIKMVAFKNHTDFLVTAFEVLLNFFYFYFFLFFSLVFCLFQCSCIVMQL